ncbi:hypothetical protein [Nonomuraea jabiensis]|uniref:hypothetical protein n=1 Tax=Nonomuraea jabiensis TaxID=882448 RepID=UPI003678AB99
MTSPSDGEPSSDDPSAEPPETPQKESRSADGGESIKWILGSIVGWFVVGAPVVIGFSAAVMGQPTEGPDIDKLLDRFYWWVALGVPVVIAVVVGSFWGATSLLARRRERVQRRELVLTERAKGLQTMVREAQEVSRELELYLEERLAALQELSAQVDNKERLASLTPEQVKALDEVLRRQFTGSRRSGLITQIVFLVLAFLLGFVVNWLSGPLLAIVQRWWS